MNTRRLRLVRPRWTMGTMLLIVGWSAVVVWLNVRPRIEYLPIPGQEDVVYHASFGCPWTYAFDLDFFASSPPRFGLSEALTHDTWVWPLTGNTAIGLLAVAILTFASEYLLRGIVSGLRAFVGKPPPSNTEGPERPNQSL